jgi:hypothetical protein
MTCASHAMMMPAVSSLFVSIVSTHRPVRGLREGAARVDLVTLG